MRIPDRKPVFMRRAGWSVLLLAVAGGAAFFVAASNRNMSDAKSQAKSFGNDRLVAIEPFADENGQMCAFEPVRLSAAQQLYASMQQRRAEQGAAATGGDATRAAIAKRPPERVMRDPSSAFSGVAIDLKNNEVVLTDENNFALMSYDRLENTPPRASMSEPKRIIKGMDAYLEYNCAVYVDPGNGDIYAVNNDTLNWMTVFSRELKGNTPPTRKLRAPHTVFGIAVDEKRQEILLAEQDDHAVVVFKKDAKDHDSPVRVLQGSKTLLADPHGIAIDEKKQLIYVTNWGTNNERPELGDPSVKPTKIGGVTRTLWPVERNHSVASSGKILPPSITVYEATAGGNSAPIRVIEGPKTLMNWPTAIAVDPEHGELFVANDTSDTVTVYKADASGDAAPIRTIKGQKSMVKNPTGIAYDAQHDELWVANFGSHSATVFKRTASGDATPLRVIRSAPIEAPSPMMGNPHTVTYDTKREEILVSN